MRQSRAFRASPFRKKPKSKWPNAVDSVGALRGTKGGCNCWEAKGPAEEVFRAISSQILDLLERCCERVPNNKVILIELYMLGDTPENAVPHIMFGCTKMEPRKKALEHFRKSEIMSKLPRGIETGHWDFPPHIIEPRQLVWTSATRRRPTTSITTFEAQPLPLEAHTTISALQFCIRPPFPLSQVERKATIGATFSFAGKTYVLVPAHARMSLDAWLAPSSKSDDEDPGDDECEFGGFDDLSDIPDEEDVDATSQYSVTPEQSDQESDGGFGSLDTSGSDESHLATSSTVDRRPPEAAIWTHPLPSHPKDTSDISPTPAFQPDSTQNPQRVRLDGPCRFTSVTLDYLLIEVDGNDPLVSQLPVFSSDSVANVGREEVSIVTVTSSNGFITGTLSGRPSYVQLPYSTKFQETYTVKVDGPLQPGDCGSIIRDDKSGAIYGYIVAGSTKSHVAYIIPAMNVLNDLKKQIDASLSSAHPLTCQENLQEQLPVSKDNVDQETAASLTDRINALIKQTQSTESRYRELSTEHHSQLPFSSQALTTESSPAYFQNSEVEESSSPSLSSRDVVEWGSVKRLASRNREDGHFHYDPDLKKLVRKSDRDIGTDPVATKHPFGRFLQPSRAQPSRAAMYQSFRPLTERGNLSMLDDPMAPPPKRRGVTEEGKKGQKPGSESSATSSSIWK